MPADSGGNGGGYRGAFWQGVAEGADRHSQFPADCLPGSASLLSTPGAGPGGRSAGGGRKLAGCVSFFTPATTLCTIIPRSSSLKADVTGIMAGPSVSLPPR
jgi:hypothetical protein